MQCIALYFDTTKSHWQAGYCYLWQCNVVYCKYFIAWGPQPIKSHKNYEPVWKAVYCAPWHTDHCFLYTLNYTLYSLLCTLYNFQCWQFTVHRGILVEMVICLFSWKNVKILVLASLLYTLAFGYHVRSVTKVIQS